VLNVLINLINKLHFDNVFVKIEYEQLSFQFTLIEINVKRIKTDTFVSVFQMDNQENLKYETKHNVVAMLDPTIPEAEGYEEMIRFILRTKYVYAMCAKPIVYKRLIKKFWNTAEILEDDQGQKSIRGHITRQLQITVS